MTLLDDYVPTAEDRQREVDLQDAEFATLLSEKQPGMRAFVGRDSRSWHVPVMVGSRTAGWTRGLDCFGADFVVRARDYVDRYNQA
jgi:hypothetical protein